MMLNFVKFDIVKIIGVVEVLFVKVCVFEVITKVKFIKSDKINTLLTVELLY